MTVVVVPDAQILKPKQQIWKIAFIINSIVRQMLFAPHTRKYLIIMNHLQLDREKQKVKKEDRKEKEKKRTQKQERRAR